MKQPAPFYYYLVNKSDELALYNKSVTHYKESLKQVRKDCKYAKSAMQNCKYAKSAMHK